MKNKVESPTFTLIIDEERSKILNLLIASILEEDGTVTPKFQGACISLGISFDALENLSDEVNEKTHAKDWCCVDDCTYGEDLADEEGDDIE